MAKKFVRPFTPAWRWLIAASSVGAFVGGWAVIAHAPNPYETTAEAAPLTTPVPEAATPVPNLNQAPTPRSQRAVPQRQVQPVPTQDSGSTQETAPQVQPTLRTQRSTRIQRQPRLRSGGS